LKPENRTAPTQEIVANLYGYAAIKDDRLRPILHRIWADHHHWRNDMKILPSQRKTLTLRIADGNPAANHHR
jgi:hypothetical protein